MKKRRPRRRGWHSLARGSWTLRAEQLPWLLCAPALPLVLLTLSVQQSFSQTAATQETTRLPPANQEWHADEGAVQAGYNVVVPSAPGGRRRGLRSSAADSATNETQPQIAPDAEPEPRRLPPYDGRQNEGARPVRDGPGGARARTVAVTGAAPEIIPPGEPTSDIASVFPTIEVTPIDLVTALRMVDVQNPQFLLAQSRVLEAIALRQLAAAQYLPTINAGTSYDGHTGNLQQSDGNILSVKRNSLTVGAGVNAVAAGSVNIPGVVWNQNLSLVLFEYLRSRQVVAERQFNSASTRNDMGLAVTRVYLDLLEAEGQRSIQLEAFGNASELARITRAFAQVGQGRPADADRAETERLDREALVIQAEGQAVAVSARLAQLLAIDPSARLHPTDNWVTPHNLVPEPIPLKELLMLALLQRPELGERRAAIREATFALRESKLLPFSPTVYLGFSADLFGGGSNLVDQPVGSSPFARGEPRFGSFGDRTDFDAIAYWTLKNIGLGNQAQIAAAASRLRQADWERLGQLEQVRMEVANAYARAAARLAQMQTGEEAVGAARDSWFEDLTRIRGNEGLPLEAVNSLRLLARSRLAYLRAIVEYNRAQFELYVALGQPPADALLRPAGPELQPAPRPAGPNP